ncbi:hypothetical protein F0237_15015 [Vibrio tubiashii]|uniref:Uncharacterized protein n=1 Tax=Vibrio tubiashii TaxID=29498 RepID=A0AAE5GSJ4_9VIBR|nr:hypothetical protein [Vibrio tubiashii]
MFAITQSGVENNDLIVHVCFLSDSMFFTSVNRLLPLLSNKKLGIKKPASKCGFCVILCGYFSSTAYPRDCVTIRRRLSRIEKRFIIVNGSFKGVK